MLSFCHHLRAWSHCKKILKGTCGGQTLKKEIWSPDCSKTLFFHFFQIHTVRNWSVYRCMSWMQFLFLVTVKKKILWKYIHALCIYQHKFSLQMYSYCLPWKRLVSFRKIERTQHLKGIYDFFKVLFIISSVLSKICWQVFFFSFNVSNLEIKKCIHFVLCLGNKSVWFI